MYSYSVRNMILQFVSSHLKAAPDACQPNPKATSEEQVSITSPCMVNSSTRNLLNENPSGHDLFYPEHPCKPTSAIYLLPCST